MKRGLCNTVKEGEREKLQIRDRNSGKCSKTVGRNSFVAEIALNFLLKNRCIEICYSIAGGSSHSKAQICRSGGSNLSRMLSYKNCMKP